LDTLAHSGIIFTMSDEILAKVNYQRMVLGKKINEDLSVISTSDGSFLYLIFFKITFIKGSGRRMGKCASELIISSIASGDNAQTVHLELPAKLIEFDSINDFLENKC